jgi:hypothetical protein
VRFFWKWKLSNERNLRNQYRKNEEAFEGKSFENRKEAR